jgi:hypothetical protein
VGLDESEAAVIEARKARMREAKLRKAASGAGLTTPCSTLSEDELDALDLPETAEALAASRARPGPAKTKTPPERCLDCGGPLSRIGRGYRCLSCRPVARRPRKERPAVVLPEPAPAPVPTVARGTAPFTAEADLAVALGRAEARALAELVELLAPLPAEARRRVVGWAGSRFGEEA